MSKIASQTAQLLLGDFCRDKVCALGVQSCVLLCCKPMHCSLAGCMNHISEKAIGPLSDWVVSGCFYESPLFLQNAEAIKYNLSV